MSLSTTARRIALLSLFLLGCLAVATGPAGAAQVRPPETGPAAPVPPATHPVDTAVSQAPDVMLWIAIGVAVLLAVAGMALAAHRYRHTRRAAVSA